MLTAILAYAVAVGGCPKPMAPHKHHKPHAAMCSCIEPARPLLLPPDVFVPEPEEIAAPVVRYTLPPVADAPPPTSYPMFPQSVGYGYSYVPQFIAGGYAINGTNGVNGTNGKNGNTGTPGTNGATGGTGASGAIGATGASGSNGAPGANGATGQAGPAGPTGPTGSDGPSYHPPSTAKCPELSGSGAGAGLTLIGLCVLVLTGRRPK